MRIGSLFGKPANQLQDKNFRSDVDGLRAIAVLPVLLYHANIPWFSGGFIGVDIFFVISGYLITGMLMPIKSVKSQGFLELLSQFYVRRARRILPALYFVILVTAIVGFLFFSNLELRELGTTIIGASLMISNFVFYYAGGYFGKASIEQPILHTWSLGIEEQFYLFWPLAVFPLVLGGHLNRLRWLCVFVASLSFCLCVAMQPERANGAFFMPFARAWELLLGAMVALLPKQRIAHLETIPTAVAGLILILLGFGLIGPISAVPGWPTLLPCVGTALILLANQSQLPILSSAPFTYVGRISYSLYLWHYPLLSFAFMSEGRPQSLTIRLGALFASFLLAALSWRFIERPFRTGSLSRSSSAVTGGMALFGGMLLIMVGAVACFSPDWRKEDPRITAIDLASREVNAQRATCHLMRFDPTQISAHACRTGGESAPTLLLWGDSHADALFSGLASPAKTQSWSVEQRSMSSCPPLMGPPIYPVASDCQAFNRAILSRVAEEISIRGVILTARWDAYGHTLKNRELGETLAEIRRLRGPRFPVLIIASVPYPGFDVPKCVVRSIQFKRSVTGCINFRSSNRDMLSTLTPIVDPADLFCSSGKCLASINGALLYRDDNHLSIDGANALADFITASSEWRETFESFAGKVRTDATGST